jgi:hypothetical protein
LDNKQLQNLRQKRTFIPGGRAFRHWECFDREKLSLRKSKPWSRRGGDLGDVIVVRWLYSGVDFSLVRTANCINNELQG